MAVLSILTLFAVLIGVGTVLIAIRITLERWHDPKHSLRRSTGICLKILGALGLALGGAFLLGLLLESDTPMLKAHWEPGNSGLVRHEAASQILGPGALSVWLLLSAAAIGFGMSLDTRRYSLGHLLLALVLMASIASLPQFLLHPKDQMAVISVKTDRVLNAEESTSMERALSKESLCEAVREKVQETLPCPVADALRKVELQLETTGELERSGTVGVRLTLWFSHELDREQIETLFDAFNKHAGNAVHSSLQADADPSAP